MWLFARAVKLLAFAIVHIPVNHVEMWKSAPWHILFLLTGNFERACLVLNYSLKATVLIIAVRPLRIMLPLVAILFVGKHRTKMIAEAQLLMSC